MIYADLHPGRYAPPSRFSPQGLGGALILTGAVVTAMTFVAPHVARIVRDGPITIESYPVPKPPPPEPQPKPKPQPRRAAQPAEKPVPSKAETTTASETHIDFTPTQPPPSAGDLKGHFDLKKRGTDRDLKCILLGVSRDLTNKVNDLKSAASDAALARALGDTDLLLRDNIDVIVTPDTVDSGLDCTVEFGKDA